MSNTRHLMLTYEKVSGYQNYADTYSKKGIPPGFPFLI